MIIEKNIKSKSKNFKFSIIIPTWNNLEYLKLCVKSIQKNSQFNHQIIVHVNEGNDGTIKWIEEQAEVDYTHNKENIGICYALNIARSLIKTEYIIYMNDDMYVTPNWDMYLSDEIEKIGDNNFFLSATMIEPKTGNPSCIEFDCGNRIENFDETKLLQNFENLEKENWSGSTWPPNIVHKDTWDLVGGYSTEFTPGMYSDPDFSMKLWNLGVRIFKGIGKSKVYHFSSISTDRIKKNNGYYQFLNKWGITSRTFTEKYLLVGQKFKGDLKTPKLSLGIKFKNKIKRMLNS